MSETVDRPMPTTLAQAYAMKAREDQDVAEVIASIFSLYDIEMHALIDPDSCDAPNPGCPLTTRQPAEFYVSHFMRHVHV